MLEGTALEVAIASLPGEKVTAEKIKDRIKSVSYFGPDDSPTVTVCNIVLDNGYTVRGESACVDPINFDQEIGESLAYKQAFDKLWPLFGFLLAETRFLREPKGFPAALLLIGALLF